MSGGSYNYAYQRVEDFISELAETTPLRKAFKAHLYKVARAMRDIEWVDSGDCSPGEEDAEIRALLGPNVRAMELAVVVADAKVVMDQLRVMIETIEKEAP